MPLIRDLTQTGNAWRTPPCCLQVYRPYDTTGKAGDGSHPRTLRHTSAAPLPGTAGLPPDHCSVRQTPVYHVHRCQQRSCQHFLQHTALTAGFGMHTCSACTPSLYCSSARAASPDDVLAPPAAAAEPDMARQGRMAGHSAAASERVDRAIRAPAQAPFPGESAGSGAGGAAGPGAAAEAGEGATTPGAGAAMAAAGGRSGSQRVLNQTWRGPPSPPLRRLLPLLVPFRGEVETLELQIASLRLLARVLRGSLGCLRMSSHQPGWLEQM